MTKKSKSAAVDLSKIHRQLSEEFGKNAPSYPTLRRWLAEGLLQKAVRGGDDGDRTVFHYATVRQIYLRTPHATRSRKSDDSDEAPAAATPAKEELPPQPLIAQLPDDFQDELKATMEAIKNALTNLVVVQRNLAAKYDAVTTHLSNDNERLKLELAAARRSTGSSDATLEMAKISRALSQLNDRVSTLTELVESR